MLWWFSLIGRRRVTDAHKAVGRALLQTAAAALDLWGRRGDGSARGGRAIGRLVVVIRSLTDELARPLQSISSVSLSALVDDHWQSSA